MKRTLSFLFSCLLGVALVSCEQEANDELLSRLDTIEKVTISSIQGQLTAINSTLGTLQGTQTQLSGYVTSLQTSVGGLQGDYNGLLTLVNSLKDKDDAFDGELQSLKDYVDQCDGDVKAWVEQSYASLNLFNSLQESVSGINTSITTINGRLDTQDSNTQQIAADLKEKTDTLTNRLSRSQVEIEGIKTDLKKLQNEMDSVKEQMAAIVSAVQSVVVVPDYSDGSVKMTEGANNPLRFEVYPLEAAKNVAALGVSALSLDCVETETKSSIFTNIPISSVTFDGEVLKVIADGSNLPEAAKSGDTAINARLRISDGTVTRSSEYFFMTYKVGEDPLEIRYTTIDGSMISISDFTHVVKHYRDEENGENVLVVDIPQVPYGWFNNNNKLLTVSISEGFRHISGSAFYNCNKLAIAKLPSSIQSIGGGVFNYCSSLSTLIIKSVNPPLISSSILDYSTSFVLYVPEESLDKYKSQQGWCTSLSDSDFSNKIKPIILTSIDAHLAIRDSTTYAFNAIIACDFIINGLEVLDKTIYLYYSDQEDTIEGLFMRGSMGVYGFHGFTGSLVASLSNLSFGTQYHVIAVAQVYDRLLFTQPITITTKDSISLSATGLGLDDNLALIKCDFLETFSMGYPDRANNISNVCIYYSDNEISLEGLIARGSIFTPVINNTFSLKNFSCSLNGLSSGAKYSFVANVKLGDRDFYSEVSSFTTCTFVAGEAVDLGLSVKWSSTNLGAAIPEQFGAYYAWGEVEPKENYSRTNYKWYENGSNTAILKYNYNSTRGTVDNKMVLDPEDDAAHVVLGGKWRMPTNAEWNELIDNCEWTWTARNGVNGYLVTSKKEGCTNNSIFIPAAGHPLDLAKIGVGADIWSSSLREATGVLDGNSAYHGRFYNDSIGCNPTSRYVGLSIRPVYAE